MRRRLDQDSGVTRARHIGRQRLERAIHVTQAPFTRTWAAVIGVILGLLALLLLPPPQVPSSAGPGATPPAGGDCARR